jgi:hypothetical protein
MHWREKVLWSQRKALYFHPNRRYTRGELRENQGKKQRSYELKYSEVVEIKDEEARVIDSEAYHDAVRAFVRQMGGAPSVVASLILADDEILSMTDLGTEAVRKLFLLAKESSWWSYYEKDWELAQKSFREGTCPVKKWDLVRLIAHGFLPERELVTN